MNIQLHNHFIVKIIKPDGNEVEGRAYNLVTNNGTAQVMSGVMPNGNIALGTGNATPAVTDTNLATKVATVTGSRTSKWDHVALTMEIKFVGTLAESANPNTDFTEVGLEGTGGLYTRALFTDAHGAPTVVHKGPLDRMEVTAIMYIQFIEGATNNLQPAAAQEAAFFLASGVPFKDLFRTTFCGAMQIGDKYLPLAVSSAPSFFATMPYTAANQSATAKLTVAGNTMGASLNGSGVSFNRRVHTQNDSPQAVATSNTRGFQVPLYFEPFPEQTLNAVPLTPQADGVTYPISVIITNKDSIQVFKNGTAVPTTDYDILPYCTTRKGMWSDVKFVPRDTRKENKIFYVVPMNDQYSSTAPNTRGGKPIVKVTFDQVPNPTTFTTEVVTSLPISAARTGYMAITTDEFACLGYDKVIIRGKTIPMSPASNNFYGATCLPVNLDDEYPVIRVGPGKYTYNTTSGQYERSMPSGFHINGPSLIQYFDLCAFADSSKEKFEMCLSPSSYTDGLYALSKNGTEDPVETGAYYFRTTVTIDGRVYSLSGGHGQRWVQQNDSGTFNHLVSCSYENTRGIIFGVGPSRNPSSGMTWLKAVPISTMYSNLRGYILTKDTDVDFSLHCTTNGTSTMQVNITIPPLNADGTMPAWTADSLEKVDVRVLPSTPNMGDQGATTAWWDDMRGYPIVATERDVVLNNGVMLSREQYKIKFKADKAPTSGDVITVTFKTNCIRKDDSWQLETTQTIGYKP